MGHGCFPSIRCGLVVAQSRLRDFPQLSNSLSTRVLPKRRTALIPLSRASEPDGQRGGTTREGRSELAHSRGPSHASLRGLC